MSKQMYLSVDMKQLDDALMLNNTSTTSLRKCLGGNDLLVVVDITITITSDLLT